MPKFATTWRVADRAVVRGDGGTSPTAPYAVWKRGLPGQPACCEMVAGGFIAKVTKATGQSAGMSAAVSNGTGTGLRTCPYRPWLEAPPIPLGKGQTRCRRTNLALSNTYKFGRLDTVLDTSGT